ncbi:MAG TPA: GAF and ANTAR domain-containing protein [Nocardioides sp.]|uniref:GAF and ANTAR domain-containing protein n=1 Tax=Nocardioides sp. TaxID=35761 RepID=UPI002BF162AE|nr:GAF and ANTAR domain-containing protein [Nocardioides sp.]HTW18353.1 GAF and ANTAR domain-containing protein [Nocardioides sp.]
MSLAQVQQLVADEASLADDRPASAGRLQRLCRAAARALPATGVSINLSVDDRTPVTVAASHPATVQLEALQFTLGEGPFLDAHATRQPVLVADLRSAGRSRWPIYSPAVQDYGVRALFAFPLGVGGARLGAMAVYREEVGALSDLALDQAMSFAEAATTGLLDAQLAPREPDLVVHDALDGRYEVFQAQGMVMVQLGVPPLVAMARMRARAFTRSQRLSDLADDVLAGRLVFEPDEP